MNLHRNAILGLGLAAAVLAMPTSQAAPSYDGCAGFITTLPTVITQQGVWCMSADLATAMNSGDAIHVDANNVVIDCNGYKLGGLGAGDATNTIGIRTIGRSNTTVRNCNIRGFKFGIHLSSPTGGYVVEDNRLDNNTTDAITLSGDGSLVRRNLVTATGGAPVPMFGLSYAHGIFASGRVEILDNIVRGVSMSADGTASGIVVSSGDGSRIARNSVADVVHTLGQPAFAIAVYTSPGAIVRDNDLAGGNVPLQVAVYCDSNQIGARDNTSTRFEADVVDCGNLGGNTSL